MIYEIRTYTVKVRTLDTVEEIFAKHMQYRLKYSPLAGFWHTDIGPLNQVIHIWPYADLAERTRIRAQAAKDPHWPPPILDYLETMTSEILIPFPSSPELKPAKLGPVYEMRSYTIKPGCLPRLRELWDEKIGERSKLTPVALVGTTEIGELNRFIHIWPYNSLDHRDKTRRKAVETGVWPPRSEGLILTQESKIMLPAAFSPMQ